MRLPRLYRFVFPLALGLILFPPVLPAGDENTEEIRRDAVIRYLRERNIPFEERPLLTGYGGFGRSVHVVFPPGGGETESPYSFMLAVPLSAGTGEKLPWEELPFGILAALSFIEKIPERETALEIRIAFLGDEGSRLPPDIRRGGHAGLEDLCAIPDIPENTALWYLDLAEAPERLIVHHGSEKTIAPLSLIRPLPALSSARRIPYSLAIRFNEIYKLALADGPSALAVTRARGINALYLTGGGGAGEKISPGGLGDLLADYAGALRISPVNFDTHFSFISLPGKTLFITEEATVFLTIFTAGAFLLFLGIYSVRRRKVLFLRQTAFARRFWLLLILLGILAAALQGAGLFFSFLCRLLKAPPLPRYSAAIPCFTLAMLLFSFTTPFLDSLRIRRKERFYGAAALSLVSAGVFAAAALNITFIPVFIWTFLFTLAGTLVKAPALVYLTALVTPVHTLSMILNLMEEGNLKLVSSFLEGNPAVTFYIALVCLPFILLIKRGRQLALQHPPPLWQSLLPRLLFSLFNILVLVLYARWSAGNIPAPPVRRVIPDSGNSLTLGAEDTLFLDSRIFEVRLEAPLDPVRFDLFLESGPDRAPQLYAAPVPSESGDENTLRFLLGENPPNPLSLELLLPPDFSGTLRAEALYTAWDEKLDPLPPPEGGDYLLRLVKTLRISPR